jgi:hypothetical protein
MVHTYNESIKKSIILRQTFFDTCNQVIRDYPNINPKKDARVTFFTKSFAVLDSVTLCSIFGDNYLIKNRWWTTITRKYSLMPVKVNLRSDIRYTFDQFVLIGCFHFIFSSMESSLRLITKKLDPIQYEMMQANFDSIYSWLLKKLITNKRNKRTYLRLMDILKLIRNTIHNNGVYSPVPKKNKPQPRNKQITWKGITCKFIINRSIKVDDFWELAFKTTTDILPMMKGNYIF